MSEYTRDNFLIVDWKNYYSYVQQLAGKILAGPGTYDRIVGISRCGLTLGHLLSDLLQLPVIIIGAKSYTTIGKQGKITITEDLGASISNERILLVDGIADSGKTLTMISAYLKKSHPKSITTATIFYKPHSSWLPDFYAKKTKKWILFPYEATEWIRVFTENMRLKNKSSKEIKGFLSLLSYTDKQIKLAQKVSSRTK